MKWWASSGRTRGGVGCVDALERLADAEVELGAADAGDPVVDGAAHELVREAAGGRRLGQLLEARCGSPRSTRGDERAPVEPGGLGEDAQLEPRPGDGRELEQSRPSRERAATGAGARGRGCARGRAARRAAGTGARRASATSTAPLSRRSRQSSQSRSGVPSVSSPIAEASSGGRLRVGRGADERAHLLGAEAAEREPRHAVEAREVGERVGERGADLLAAVAVGGDDEQPRLRRRCAPGGGGGAASRRRPSGGRRRRAAAAGRG